MYLYRETRAARERPPETVKKTAQTFQREQATRFKPQFSANRGQDVTDARNDRKMNHLWTMAHTK
jgi:hypothetical protein